MSLIGANAQVAGDSRQRHVGDGGVQHLHKGRQRQGKRRQKQAGA